MTDEFFYEIYRKLTLGRKEPHKVGPVLDELAVACRNTLDSASSTKWRGNADNCIHEIAESSQMFAMAVARWITRSEDIDLAKALVHHASVRHLKQSVAELYDLSSVDEANAILAGCRLCALYVTPAISLGWTMSLVLSYPASIEVKEALDCLLEYHVNEFPLTTLRLLSAPNSPFASVAESVEALTFLQNEEAYLNKLPTLREFAMTPEMRLSLSSLRRRQSRDIDQHAREKSVFMQICKVDRFKYANKSAVEFDVEGSVQETTLEMSPYSLQVELPISEQTDPIAGAAHRRRLWNGVPK